MSCITIILAEDLKAEVTATVLLALGTMLRPRPDDRGVIAASLRALEADKHKYIDEIDWRDVSLPELLALRADMRGVEPILDAWLDEQSGRYAYPRSGRDVFWCGFRELLGQLDSRVARFAAAS